MQAKLDVLDPLVRELKAKRGEVDLVAESRFTPRPATGFSNFLRT